MPNLATGLGYNEKAFKNLLVGAKIKEFGSSRSNSFERILGLNLEVRGFRPAETNKREKWIRINGFTDVTTNLCTRSRRSCGGTSSNIKDTATAYMPNCTEQQELFAQYWDTISAASLTLDTTITGRTERLISNCAERVRVEQGIVDEEEEEEEIAPVEIVPEEVAGPVVEEQLAQEIPLAEIHNWLKTQEGNHIEIKNRNNTKTHIFKFSTTTKNSWILFHNLVTTEFMKIFLTFVCGTVDSGVYLFGRLLCLLNAEQLIKAVRDQKGGVLLHTLSPEKTVAAQMFCGITITARLAIARYLKSMFGQAIFSSERACRKVIHKYTTAPIFGTFEYQEEHLQTEETYPKKLEYYTVCPYESLIGELKVFRDSAPNNKLQAKQLLWENARAVRDAYKKTANCLEETKNSNRKAVKDALGQRVKCSKDLDHLLSQQKNSPMKQAMEKTLASHNIFRQAFHSHSLVGNHASKLLAKHDTILIDIRLHMLDPSKRRANVDQDINNQIEQMISSTLNLLEALDCACR
jgi:hypothetical protein